MPLNPQDQQAIVAAHNEYRSDPAINTPPLQWSSDLATGAQQWADNLATNIHHLQHSVAGTSRPDNTGENIAAAGRLPSDPPNNPASMVNQWGSTLGMNPDGTSKPSEQQNFKPGVFPDISKTGDWHDAGHYSQVIWRGTTAVGCGFATDSTPDSNGFIWDYLVGRYSPAGNMQGVQVPNGMVLPFADQGVITLKADNGQFITLLTSSDPNWNPIEASVQWSTPSTDARAQFTVSILASGKITLKTSNGKYGGRVNRGSGLDPIEAAKTSSADIYAQFSVTLLPNNQIALQADNGLYLSRVDRGVQQPIEACKTSIDTLCSFTVAVVPPAA